MAYIFTTKFHKKQQLNSELANKYHYIYSLPTLRTTKGSPVDTLIRERREANRGNMEIDVGLYVTDKDGNTEDKTRKGIRTRTRKEVADYYQTVVGKKMF